MDALAKVGSLARVPPRLHLAPHINPKRSSSPTSITTVSSPPTSPSQQWPRRRSPSIIRRYRPPPKPTLLSWMQFILSDATSQSSHGCRKTTHITPSSELCLLGWSHCQHPYCHDTLPKHSHYFILPSNLVPPDGNPSSLPFVPVTRYFASSTASASDLRSPALFPQTSSATVLSPTALDFPSLAFRPAHTNSIESSPSLSDLSLTVSATHNFPSRDLHSPSASDLWSLALPPQTSSAPLLSPTALDLPSCASAITCQSTVASPPQSAVSSEECSTNITPSVYADSPTSSSLNIPLTNCYQTTFLPASQTAVPEPCRSIPTPSENSTYYISLRLQSVDDTPVTVYSIAVSHDHYKIDQIQPWDLIFVTAFPPAHCYSTHYKLHNQSGFISTALAPGQKWLFIQHHVPSVCPHPDHLVLDSPSSCDFPTVLRWWTLNLPSIINQIYFEGWRYHPLDIEYWLGLRGITSPVIIEDFFDRCGPHIMALQDAIANLPHSNRDYQRYGSAFVCTAIAFLSELSDQLWEIYENRRLDLPITDYTARHATHCFPFTHPSDPPFCWGEDTETPLDDEEDEDASLSTASGSEPLPHCSDEGTWNDVESDNISQCSSLSTPSLQGLLPGQASTMHSPYLSQAIRHITDGLLTPPDTDDSIDCASSAASTTTTSSLVPSIYSSSSDSLLCDQDSVSHWMRRDHSVPGRHWRPVIETTSTRPPPEQYMEAPPALTRTYNRSRERLLYARMRSLSHYTKLLQRLTADGTIWACRHVDPPRYLHNSTINRSLTPSTFYGRAQTAYKPPPCTTSILHTTHTHNSYNRQHHNKTYFHDKHFSLTIKVPRKCSQQMQTGYTSLEYTLTPPSHPHHSTRRCIKILPITLSEGTISLPTHSSTPIYSHKRFSRILLPVVYMLILATTTVYLYRSLLQLTSLTTHNVTAPCFHLFLPLPTAFSHTETVTLLPFHSPVPQRTLLFFCAHTPITALHNTLLQRGPLHELSMRHADITPFPEGYSNHMGCRFAPLLLLLFEYHYYYPP